MKVLAVIHVLIAAGFVAGCVKKGGTPTTDATFESLVSGKTLASEFFRKLQPAMLCDLR